MPIHALRVGLAIATLAVAMLGALIGAIVEITHPHQ